MAEPGEDDLAHPTLPPADRRHRGGGGTRGAGLGGVLAVRPAGQAACSGWNYWYQNQYSKQTSCGCSFTYLLGFENDSTIRGTWISKDMTYANIAPAGVGMGGYLKAHITYWSGTAVSVLAWANA